MRNMKNSITRAIWGVFSVLSETAMGINCYWYDLCHRCI